MLKYSIPILLALSAMAAAARDTAGSPIVRTAYGRVQGAPADASGDVWVYRGLPYAAPPTGALRWREPQPPAAWHGVRTATEAAPGCIQSVVDSRPPWTEAFMHHGPVSEDCLYLNLWTPAHRSARSLPVLVYIYGGGFSEGSISVPLYDGAALARHQVVVVTINYRLGALGFLAHPALTDESSHHASGNYGLLDQVAALRWVRSNIAAFGGDARRVTIAGQSAGALSVYLLTASPLARGLFRGAIVQSGPGALAALGVGDLRAMTQPREDAEKAGASFALGLGATTAAELRALDAARLLPQPTAATRLRWGPSVDGWFLPVDVETIYARHAQNDVPLLIGMMHDEGSAFPGYTPERARELRERSLTGLDQLLSERARTSRQPAYAYYFQHAIPWPQQPQYGAFHSGELPYVFDNLAQLERPWSAADRALAAAASAEWAAFTAQGKPSPAGLPSWDPYVPGSRKFMVFGDSLEMRTLREAPVSGTDH